MVWWQCFCWGKWMSLIPASFIIWRPRENSLGHLPCLPPQYTSSISNKNISFKNFLKLRIMKDKIIKLPLMINTCLDSHTKNIPLYIKFIFLNHLSLLSSFRGAVKTRRIPSSSFSCFMPFHWWNILIINLIIFWEDKNIIIRSVCLKL